VATLDGVAPAGLTAAQLFGGQGAPPVTPPPGSQAGQVLVSDSDRDVLTGGAGADTLSAGRGADRLTGGAGADHFDFDALPWNAGHVTDFQPGIDKLDLRGLAPAYSGGNIVRDLALVSDGAGGTKVMLDIDGPFGGEWPFRITTLDGVAPSSLSASDWLFH
jgi:Ca2+-binding RTX toxin-like protein